MLNYQIRTNSPILCYFLTWLRFRTATLNFWLSLFICPLLLFLMLSVGCQQFPTVPQLFHQRFNMIFVVTLVIYKKKTNLNLLHMENLRKEHRQWLSLGNWTHFIKWSSKWDTLVLYISLKTIFFCVASFWNWPYNHNTVFHLYRITCLYSMSLLLLFC